jgi:7-cyano-7-deazaguanine synthase in queuosine biosynthesis
MQPERLILCGGASKTGEDAALRLATTGRRKNIILRLEDISKKLVKTVPAPLVDLLEIATYVYCADQAISRGGEMQRAMGADWHRSFRFIIPVRNPDFWNCNKVLDLLCSALSFLSEDDYAFKFEKAVSAVPLQDYLKFSDEDDAATFKPDEVLLFSGGLDSFAGAVEELCDGKRVLLVSHHASPKIFACQKHLVAKLAERFPKQIMHVPILMTRQETLPVTEHSHRSRSFLYAAFACTIARLFGMARIRFFENGVLSVNLPISTQVVGARATRTTHPSALEHFREFFGAAMRQIVDFDNPFIWKTKAQVIRLIVERGFGELIKDTISCTRIREITKMRTHCGCCSQCIDRRFAILAAGAAEHDPVEMYNVELLGGERKQDEDQTMVESYVRTALEFREIGEHAFFDRFGGETMRVCSGFPSLRADDVARQVLDLHQRHGQAIGDVLEAAVASHRSELIKGSLPPSSILMITVARGAILALARVGKHADGVLKLIEEERILAESDRREPAAVPSGIATRLSSSALAGEKAPEKQKHPAEYKEQKRGQRPIKLEQVKEAMRCDIREGRQTANSLRTMLEKNLAATYRASRDTVRKARTVVLSEFVENSNSDK